MRCAILERKIVYQTLPNTVVDVLLEAIIWRKYGWGGVKVLIDGDD